MSENRFDASRAHEEPEFGTFVEALVQFVGSKGQLISSTKSNDLEVSFKYSTTGSPSGMAAPSSTRANTSLRS